MPPLKEHKELRCPACKRKLSRELAAYENTHMVVYICRTPPCKFGVALAKGGRKNG